MKTKVIEGYAQNVYTQLDQARAKVGTLVLEVFDIINKTDDTKTLKLFLKDQSDLIRKFAVSKINDPVILEEIIESDEIAELQLAAAANLLENYTRIPDMIRDLSLNHELRSLLINKVTDDNMLSRIASQELTFRSDIDAFLRIKNDQVRAETVVAMKNSAHFEEAINIVMLYDNLMYILSHTDHYKKLELTMYRINRLQHDTSWYLKDLFELARKLLKNYSDNNIDETAAKLELILDKIQVDYDKKELLNTQLISFLRDCINHKKPTANLVERITDRLSDLNLLRDLHDELGLKASFNNKNPNISSARKVIGLRILAINQQNRYIPPSDDESL